MKGAEEEEVEENTGLMRAGGNSCRGFLQSLLMIRSQEELLQTTMLKVRSSSKREDCSEFELEAAASS